MARMAAAPKPPTLAAPAAFQSPQVLAKNLQKALGPGSQAPLPRPNRAAFPPFLAQLPGGSPAPPKNSKVSPKNLQNLQNNLAPKSAPPQRPNAPTRAPNSNSAAAQTPAKAAAPKSKAPTLAQPSASPSQPSAAPPQAVPARVPVSRPSPTNQPQLPTKATPPQPKSAPTTPQSPAALASPVKTPTTTVVAGPSTSEVPNSKLGSLARQKLESQLSRPETKSNRPVIKRETSTPETKEVAKEPAKPAAAEEKSSLPKETAAPIARPEVVSEKPHIQEPPAPLAQRVAQEAPAQPPPREQPAVPTQREPNSPPPPDGYGAAAAGGGGGGGGGQQRRRQRRQDDETQEVEEVSAEEPLSPEWGLAFSSEMRMLIPPLPMLELAVREADRYAIEAATGRSEGREQPQHKSQGEEKPRARARPPVPEEENPKEEDWLKYCDGCGLPQSSDFAGLCLPCQSELGKTLLPHCQNHWEYRLYVHLDRRPVDSLAIFRLRDFVHWPVIFKTLSGNPSKF